MTENTAEANAVAATVTFASGGEHLMMGCPKSRIEREQDQKFVLTLVVRSGDQ
jgi:copper(I)-binding protein